MFNKITTIEIEVFENRDNGTTLIEVSSVKNDSKKTLYKEEGNTTFLLNNSKVYKSILELSRKH